MGQPSDGRAVDGIGLAARLRAVEREHTALRRELADLRSQLENGVRTRRLVVVDDQDHERIVASVNDDGRGQLQIVGLDGGRATLLSTVVRVEDPDGASAQMLVTAEDAELYLGSGPRDAADWPDAARVVLDACRADGDGRASVTLVAGDEDLLA